MVTPRAGDGLRGSGGAALVVAGVDRVGELVDQEQVAVDLPGAAGLADGTYVVSWNVLSGDGHPISGALTFSVDCTVD